MRFAEKEARKKNLLFVLEKLKEKETHKKN
jgi:hypothetical protein